MKVPSPVASDTPLFSRHPGREDLLLAQHFRAVEVGDRGPAQLDRLLRDDERAGLELGRVEILGGKVDLAPAVLDIRRIVLGQEIASELISTE